MSRYLTALAEQKHLSQWMIPVMVSLLQEDTLDKDDRFSSGFWFMDRILSNDPDWNRLRHAMPYKGDAVLRTWWRQYGSQRSWPVSPYAAEVKACLLKHLK